MSSSRLTEIASLLTSYSEDLRTLMFERMLDESDDEWVEAVEHPETVKENDLDREITALQETIRKLEIERKVLEEEVEF